MGNFFLGILYAVYMDTLKIGSNSKLLALISSNISLTQVILHTAMDVHREEEGEEREINHHGKTIKVKKKKKRL